jgi:twitching motility protein PilU
MKRGGEQGMITFDQALYNLYQEGEIALEDALQHADSANEVRLMIKLRSGGSGEAPVGLSQQVDMISLVDPNEP